MLVTLALLVLAVAVVRNHQPGELGLLAGALVVCLLCGRWLLRDFRAHPAGFPAPAPSHGLRLPPSSHADRSLLNSPSVPHTRPARRPR